MEISFSSNSITNNHIAKKFGICHDSPAVVPCAKFCSDHFISIWMGAKWNFHHIWIVMEKLLVKWSPVLWLIFPWRKWPPFRRRHFQIHFLEWKVWYFDSNFTEVCSKGSNWQEVSIGSGDGLALNRWQAITWSNADPVHWCIYVA